MAGAGIGELIIVDPDIVEMSNLQRQVLYSESDVGRPKAEVSANRARAINADCKVTAINNLIGLANVRELVGRADIIIDGCDNHKTRFLVHDACWFMKKPYVYGSILQFHGQMSVMHSVNAPCLRCLFPSPPVDFLSCAEAGVFGALAGVIGSMQASAAIDYLLHKHSNLFGKLLLFDMGRGVARTTNYRRDLDCPLCGEVPSILNIREEEVRGCSVNKGIDMHIKEITISELSSHPYDVLLDVRENSEVAEGFIDGMTHIPLGQLPQRSSEIPSNSRVVCYCRSGQRSKKASEVLLAAGFSDVVSLAGGYLAYSQNRG